MFTINRATDSDVAAMHSLQMRAFEDEGRRCGTRDIPPLQEKMASVAEHVQTEIALVANPRTQARPACRRSAITA